MGDKPQKKGAWGLIVLIFRALNPFDKGSIAFLKCDAKGCPQVDYYDRLDASLIGTKCDSCGANMLTAEDFYATRSPQEDASE